MRAATCSRSHPHRHRRTGCLRQKQRRPRARAAARLCLRELRRDVSGDDLARPRTRDRCQTTPQPSSSSRKSRRMTCELREHDSVIADRWRRSAEPHLREDRVNDNVSCVSSVPRVREILVDHLRQYCAETNDLVMEGRDIGSVVFPDTPYKFYIDASPEIRAQPSRRAGPARSNRARDRPILRAALRL